MVFLLADHGWSSYSTLLETRVELIEGNPDLVQRFVDASILGWRRYLDDEDVSAANALIQRDNPAMTDAQIAFSRAKMREWELVDSGDAIDDGIGAMDVERVREFYESMVGAGMYAADDLDPAAAVTLEFVNRGVGVEQVDHAAE